MKALIVTLDSAFPVTSNENLLILRYDVVDDVLYELADTLFDLIGENKAQNKSDIFSLFKSRYPSEYNRFVDSLIKSVRNAILSQKIPNEISIVLSSVFVEFLRADYNNNYSRIGKILKNRNCEVVLSIENIYIDQVKPNIISSVSNILKDSATIDFYTIKDCDNEDCQIIQDINARLRNLQFQPYSGGLVQYELGNAYEHGLSVHKDISKAIEHYKIASEQNNYNALARLGHFYKEGVGFPVDYQVAFSYYLKAAEGNNAEALFNIGVLYEKGLGVEQDYKKAIEYYEKAAVLGNVLAQLNLANIYYEGCIDSPDYEEALRWYRLCAEDDKMEFAQYRAGEMLLNGKGCANNPEKALHYYLKAAENNFMDSCFQSGQLIEKGYGSMPNSEQAYMELYRKGAEANEYKACTELAIQLKETADTNRLMELLKPGVQKGYDKAQYELALLLHRLSILLEDDSFNEIRDNLLRVAAEQGYEPALKTIGDLGIK